MVNNSPTIGIYKITNPKGNIYVGKSSNIEKRRIRYEKFTKHISSQPRIYNSIMKYGWDLHSFEIIELCALDELDDREVYWKKYYLADLGGWDNVLFCNIYDTGGGPMSEETRKKISNSLMGSQNMLGKKHSDETKKLMSEKAKGKPKSESHKQNLRKPKSDQAKINISLGKKGKPGSRRNHKNTDEHNKKISLSKIGVKRTLQQKQNIGKGKLGKKIKGKSVLNTLTGEIWKSKSLCANHYGVTSTTINNWIKLSKNNLKSL